MQPYNTLLHSIDSRGVTALGEAKPKTPVGAETSAVPPSVPKRTHRHVTK